MKTFNKVLSFLKSNAILLILLVCVGVYAYRLKLENDSLTESTTQVSKAPIELKQAIIKRFTDSLTHDTHTSFTNKNANLPAGSLSNGVINKPLLDSIAKSLDIKSSQVTSYAKFNQVSEAKNLKANKTIDSLQRLVYQYSNGFITQTFRFTDSTRKEGVFGYRYNQAVKLTTYNSKHFLGIPIGQDVYDIASNDPNSTFNDLNSFSIRPKDRFFGAEVQALTSYNLRSGTLSPGVGVQLKLGLLYVAPALYYNGSTRQFNPLITGRFAIFKTPK